jgi:hypothetical protein
MNPPRIETAPLSSLTWTNGFDCSNRKATELGALGAVRSPSTLPIGNDLLRLMSRSAIKTDHFPL